MAASVEPGTGCDLVWPAAGSPEVWAAAGPTPIGSTPNTFAGSTSSPLLDVVAWHRDAHGEPAAAEQDVPTVQGMLTVGSAIPTAMRASRPHVEPPRRTRRPEPRYPEEDVTMTINNRIKSIVRGARYRIQQAKGRAKQTAGKATGNDSLRRRGKAEQRKSRLNQFAKKIKDAITR
jgi:uncharacterized protein YjbJ (UPF0337 family)